MNREAHLLPKMSLVLKLMTQLQALRNRRNILAFSLDVKSVRRLFIPVNLDSSMIAYARSDHRIRHVKAKHLGRIGECIEYI